MELGGLELTRYCRKAAYLVDLTRDEPEPEEEDEEMDPEDYAEKLREAANV